MPATFNATINYGGKIGATLAHMVKLGFSWNHFDFEVDYSVLCLPIYLCSVAFLKFTYYAQYYNHK